MDFYSNFRYHCKIRTTTNLAKLLIKNELLRKYET